MEFEFDKEMDSLLRQTAQREIFNSSQHNAHIDADEISLFAENALTKNARMRVTEHLADCMKCRKILSNVITLNSEASSEIVHTKESATVASETPIPWYRKLFIFPQLAYTMGGLTILLAGMVGYVTLQSYNSSQNDSVAQLENTIERPSSRSGGADSDGDTVTTEVYSANTATNFAPTPMANSAVNSAAKTNSPMSAANSATVPARSKKDNSPETAGVQSAPVPADTTLENEKDLEKKEAKPEQNRVGETADRAVSRQDYSQNRATQEQATIMPDSRNTASRRMQSMPRQSAPMSIQQAEPPPPAAAREIAKPKSSEDSAAVKNKTVSGKNFVYKDGVWYDKSYRQQKTRNISRYSEDYKKLDSGLRSIADNLGGTAVIVWKNTAYRIQ